jgi:type III restriction enzyme
VPVVIENPILNSAYAEPTRHFRFDDDGITDEIVSSRRASSYFVPIPAAKRRGGQQAFDTEWTRDRVAENETVNRIRDLVSHWRAQGHPGVTSTTRVLLEYWTDPERDNRLFFCQVEAAETAIYLSEVAPKIGGQWILNKLREDSDRHNPSLLRVAHKMATGTGKTVLMAMLVAWQTLNKGANPQDARFTDAFLVVTPGITIRDRLRVILPSDPGNYYRERDLVPAGLVGQLGRARIVITNFHAFLPRETGIGKASKLTKELLTQGGGPSPFTETPAQIVNRVCRDLGTKRQIIVLNDEAHHCYRRRLEDEQAGPKLSGEDLREAKIREEEARVWVTGLSSVHEKIGIKTVYDLSATPFFLRGSGYSEGTLFPWVVSDFSLIDAIESGVVKIPRVPIDDNAMTGTTVTYRDLWLRIRDALPKKGRRKRIDDAGPIGDDELELAPVSMPVLKLPTELQGALHSLYGNYEKAYRAWESSEEARSAGWTPPVFIVVCNNTTTSKLVYDYVAGYEKELPGGTSVAVPGELALFSNVADGHFTARPLTILVDSAQLESGEGMSDEFKRLAATEIADFKAEYEARFAGRDAEDLTDEDLLREVMNTVGKPGRLGEHVRCVVSVSMLTEGWDANTVTHVLGVRAFGTQLLCEQVVGRALRRRGHVTDEEDHFSPEYAEVYGVPFSFIPAAGAVDDPKILPPPTHVRALEERAEAEISFPRVVGYRYEFAADRLDADFKKESMLVLSAADVPTVTDIAGIVGETTTHTLDDLKNKREQEVAFWLAKRLLERKFLDSGVGGEPAEEVFLFPQLLAITRRFMAERVRCKDDAFVQMLLLHRIADDACDRIYRAIARHRPDGPDVIGVRPALHPFEPTSSTRFVSFDTRRPTYRTGERCHVSHVVCDTGSWEQKLARSLEEMDEVRFYVKNEHLGFAIPYTFDGEEHNYFPDFIARVDDGNGPEDLLNLIIEVSGAGRRDKAAKVATTRTMWLPAVNGTGAFGRWDYVEVRDPWEAKSFIRKHVSGRSQVGLPSLGARR